MALRVGSGLPNIQKKDLLNFTIRFPPLSEQNIIVEILNTARQEIDLLKKQAEAYRKQKRGLMQKLLTGQWRVGVD
jgi:type I restriction enzyme S subunit